MTQYLEGHANIDLESINNIISDRNAWINRPSSKNYSDVLAKLPDTNTFDEIETLAKDLIPWRKGPIDLPGLTLDAEWRSDLKWERIKNHLAPLQGKRVLDIGCNNGYYMFKMAEQSPSLVLGIDPVLHYQTQFNFIQNFFKAPNVHFEMLGVEHLNHFNEFFDTIFSMGIIYHHRHPIQQLLDIKNALRPGGQVILETIGIPGVAPVALCPMDRYAKMKNIWFVPTLNCLIAWAHKTKFCDIEVIADTLLTPKEQRTTKWSGKQSLIDFLDPEDPTKTIEGHPAPRRFCLSMKKKG
ncbi:MAG: tRNA 5-methoxyuridine(34)/uridine 5-oxyacetic acid(34) synthase CmoB [Epsilonproteobacteria bacterium]|nr:MAG: tRNA 5-methoxyuridine(34)/uridine 5-oxyacetic acid(34) synthase CmoB [Campylobacterota bacterium]RLA67772.1 MAG: tRNA 5-methoxyuridine(34)/uridine 5-oxyacetic acid(34) synthase CmoB [Campylobacterota bacterium]